ncbi:hypothetical protein BH09VER1_BH09VER1_13130 [soil metagenome]
MKLSFSLFLCATLPLVSIYSQEDGTPASGKTARTGYMALKSQDLPRDEKGFLKPEVWDLVIQQAKDVPNSNEARVLAERDVYKTYYATFANWTPPPPLPASEGHLRNLADAPKEPRFVITDKVWPAKPGDASVCLWADDKLAAFSLGVDDNNAMDIPYWMELSKKYHGLPITWNIITANIDGVVSKGRIVQAGKWETWQKLLDEGYHLASHSMTHNHSPVPADGWPGPDWEAAASRDAIDSHLPGHKTRAFVYPGSGVHVFGIFGGYTTASNWRPALTKYYVTARGGGGEALNQANLIDYFNVHSTTGGVPFLLNDKDPRYAAQNLNNLLNADPKNPYYKYYRGWGNVFIHFINNGKDWTTNPFNIAYDQILQFCDQHREELWLGYFDDVALYGEERDTATLTTNEVRSDQLSFTLVSKMEPATFDYPLTVKVRLQDNWKGVAAKQNNADIPATFLVHEGVPYALVKAVPDRGIVTLTPAPAK